MVIMILSKSFGFMKEYHFLTSKSVVSEMLFSDGYDEHLIEKVLISFKILQ